MDTYFRNEWQTHQLQIISPLLQQPIELANVKIFNHTTMPYAEIPYDTIVQKINKIRIEHDLDYKMDLTIIAINKATQRNGIITWRAYEMFTEVSSKVIYVTATDVFKQIITENGLTFANRPKYTEWDATQNGYCDECEIQIDTQIKQLLIITICEQLNDFTDVLIDTYICWNLVEKTFADIFIVRTICNY